MASGWNIRRYGYIQLEISEHSSFCQRTLVLGSYVKKYLGNCWLPAYHQKHMLKSNFRSFRIFVYKLWSLVLVKRIKFRGWTLVSVLNIILREDVYYELSYLTEFRLPSVERTGKVDGSKIMMSANFEQKVKKGIFDSWRK